MIRLRNTTLVDLPYPPTMNTYWRHRIAGKPPRQFLQSYISPEGRAYAGQVQALLAGAERREGPLAVTVWVWMPDRRARDLDNLLKPLLDACTPDESKRKSHGLWLDDSQIKRLAIICRGVRQGGAVKLRVKALPEPQATLFANDAEDGEKPF